MSTSHARPRRPGRPLLRANGISAVQGGYNPRRSPMEYNERQIENLLLENDRLRLTHLTHQADLALQATNQTYLVDQIMVLVETGIEAYGEHLDAGATVEEAVTRALRDAREEVEEWLASFQPLRYTPETKP